MSEAPIVPPGQQMTPEQKRDMATFNAEETERAHKQAADQKALDAQREAPLMEALSGSIKEKLEALPPEEGATPAA